MPSVTPKGFPTVLHRNTVEIPGSNDELQVIYTSINCL